jgi:4-carboxymuconolactone decarboxylase
MDSRSLSVPRVPLLPGDADDDLAKTIRARRGGQLATLDRILLHSPPIAEGWNTMFAAIRTKTTLADDLRELAMLRVASLNGDLHNWGWHVPIAREAGITDAEIDGLRDWRAVTTFTDVQRAVLAYAEVMTVDVSVPDDVFSGVRRHLSDRDLVELTATIGAYNLVSRFLVAMKIEREI